VGFDAGRAAVVAGDGVVARYAGLLCVARCTDPDTLAHLLELCASVAGRDPGRVLARRLAVWLAGADAPGEGLAFGTVATAGPRVAVFLSGAAAVVVPDRSVNLSGADSAAWTDRLIDHPDTPLVLTLDGATARPDPAGGLHDLRVGVVPGAGVVLFPVPVPVPVPDPGGNGIGAGPGAESAATDGDRVTGRVEPRGHETGRPELDWFAGIAPTPGPVPGPAVVGGEGPPAAGGPGAREHIDARPDGDPDADVAPNRSAPHRGRDGPAPAGGDGGSGWPWTGPIGRVGPDALFEPGPLVEPGPVVEPAGEGTGTDRTPDAGPPGRGDTSLPAFRPAALGAPPPGAIPGTHPGPETGTDGESGTGGRHAAHAAGEDPHRPDTSDATRTPAPAVPSGDGEEARAADTLQRPAHALDGDGPPAHARNADVRPAHALDDDGHADDASTEGARAGAGESPVRRPPPGDRHAVAGTRETSRPAAADREPPTSDSFASDSFAAGPSAAGPSAAGPSEAGLSTAELSTAEQVVSDRSVVAPTAAPAGSGPDRRPGDPQRATTPPGGPPDRAPTNGVERADDPDPPTSERTAGPAVRRNGAAHELREDHGLCPHGHPIDPHSTACALCEPEQGSGSGPSPRPSSGLLVFDDGAIYTVDAGYLIGRMPAADPRTGSGMLRSIVVEDPSGAVSRVHAEVLVDGAEVVIVDSGSRNGTFVAGPGEAGWTALSPGRAQPLLPGTRVRMGKRTFVFEAPAGVR